MLSSIKTGWRAWMASLGVLARSPLYLLALAALAGLWGLGGYEWLWLPESSGWVLGLGLVWVLALAGVMVAILAGTVASVTDVASGAERRLRLRKILTFERRRFGLAALTMLAAVVLGVALDALVGWINGHALAAASFLTFHAQRPVSYLLIAKVFWALEALLWIAFAGFLAAWLLALSEPRLRAAQRLAGHQPARPFGLSALLTGVVTASVFGGLAWCAATWHPVVKPGGWDYAQLALRMGAALLLLALGWLFWALALARLTMASATAPAASPPHA